MQLIRIVGQRFTTSAATRPPAACDDPDELHKAIDLDEGSGATAASMYLTQGIFTAAGGREAGGGATDRRWLTLATLNERVPKTTLLQKLEEYEEAVRAARMVALAGELTS